MIVELEGAGRDWAGVATAAGATVDDMAGSVLTLGLASTADIPALVSALVSGGARILRVEPQGRSLEDVYLSLVDRREGAA